MRLAALLLAAAVFMTSVAPVLADTPDDYHEAIAQALSSVRQSLEQGDPTPEVAAAAAVRVLERVRVVELGEDRGVPVDTSWVLSALEKSPPNLRLAEVRLESLLDELEGRVPARVDSAKAEQALQREVDRLSRPEAQRMPWDDLLDTLRQVGRDFLTWLASLFRFGPSPNNADGGASFPWWGAGVVVALLLALALAIRSVRQAVVPNKESGPAASQTEEHLASGEYLAQAQSLAASGQLREAVRALYLSAVLHLDERGEIAFDPSMTNREYLSLAATRGRLLELLSPLVQAFDAHWYGRQLCTPSEFEQCRQLARKIGLAV